MDKDQLIVYHNQDEYGYHLFRDGKIIKALYKTEESNLMESLNYTVADSLRDTGQRPNITTGIPDEIKTRQGIQPYTEKELKKVIDALKGVEPSKSPF